jgi:hypothetical protein
MKTLTRCPKCKIPLKSEYQSLVDGTGYWNKSCWSPNHRFYTRTVPGNDDEAADMLISLSTKKFIMAVWRFNKKTLKIRTSDSPEYSIPFFEPDLTDYNKLIDKIKTYIVFG